MSAIPHHTTDAVCPLCEIKLSQAHPDLASWYRKVVKPIWPLAHISWSYRGEADQELAFQEHKTQLHYPHSAHNKTDDAGNPQAMALDLFEINDAGAATFDPGFYAAINALNERVGHPIEWGGKWRSLGDADHFQFKQLS